jgi:Fe-S-cluster containining protein
MAKKKKKLKYDCNVCPAYCCSYPRIVVRKRDIERLAEHFGLDPEVARRRFTKKGEEKKEIVLRHKKDEHFGTVCRFLDSETRNCTVYEARPKVCREFPGEGRCGYYEFLKFERDAQEDDEHIASTWNH